MNIPSDFLHGGSGLTPDNPNSLAKALRDIADDLNGLQPATVASSTITDSAGGTYTATEQGMLNDAKAICNEVKTVLNAMAAYSLTTVKS